MSNMRRIIILMTALALLAIPAAASASTWSYQKMNRGERAGFVSDMRQPQRIQHGGAAWQGPCSKTRGEAARNGPLGYAAFDVKCREPYLIFAKKTLPGKWAALTLGTGGFGYFGMPQGIEKTLMYKLTGYYGLAVKRLKASGQSADSAALASTAPIRECGNITQVPGRVFGSPGGIINLTTRNVACGYARGFSMQVTKHRDQVFQGFGCHEGTLGLYESDIRCVKGSDVIHWQIGD